MGRRGYGYGYGNSYGAVPKGSVEIGETHAVVDTGDSSAGVVVRILGVERGEGGAIERVILDSLVHGQHDKDIGDWRATGCFVTELTPKKRGY